MNLADGKIIDRKAADSILEALDKRIIDTLSKPPLAPRQIIEACSRLTKTMDEARYLNIMAEIGISPALGRGYLEEAKVAFSAEYLTARVNRELGDDPWRPATYEPPYSGCTVTETIEPLGVLLHIAAGNADGLPAFSVLEGLLAGNINILKLPEVDGGISVLLLQELIREEPALAEYIYVFDYSSGDTQSITRLVEAADGVVVWGGDAAVSAVRAITPPNVKLIEWGHKVSFAYITPQGIRLEPLARLAEHIVTTNQLLCTSCQGIWLDTEDMDVVRKFCKDFLPVLEQARRTYGAPLDLGAQAQVTLRLYNESLETTYNGKEIFRGVGCSLIASPDQVLEPSLQFANCWVKPLPRQQILSTLRRHKNHLQTVGLLCDQSQQEELAGIFRRVGAVRITSPARMSETYCGAAHDGEYALRRYTKVVALEK